MSLPAPAPRRHLHTRTIACEGYERDDGLFDIEARMLDTKTYAIDEPYRGRREAGAPVHDMQLRLTIDRAMAVRDIEVATNDAPYDACFTVAPAYRKLVGARIGGGWRRAVSDAVGGTAGCTHLRELLLPAATVAFQTMGSWPKEGQVATEAHPDTAKKLGLQEGAWVTIETPEGKIKQRLSLNRSLDPRVVVAAFGWWFPEKSETDYGWSDSNINILTPSGPNYDPSTGGVTLRGIPCRVSAG